MGVFDGGDPNYDRFRIKDYEIREESIIASRQNIYIRFPIVRLKTSKLSEIKNNPPEYVINPTDKKENKEARFLQTLYNNKRFASFIKTFNYFQQQYPNSKYDEILRNMLADVHYERWKDSKSKSDKITLTTALKYLIEKYPTSVLTERSQLILAYIDLENRDGVGTIQKFLDFLDNRKESTSRDQACKALSDGYLLINKYEEALHVLNELEKNPDQKKSGIEATYRKGDVYFQSGNYKGAIDAYKSAVERFPLEEDDFENANYNLAESYFWTGQFKNALNHYVRFVELFPSHPHGSYALTRIGEVLDILGADQSKVMGAYLESNYRFKNSEGAEVAKVRMLSQKMKNMKPKEMAEALDEMNRIAHQSKLPRMEEFVTLMVADGLHRRGEYQKGLEYLISYYQRNPTSTDVSFFRKRILKNIGDLIKNHIDKSEFLDVLQVNGKYSTTWLNNLDRYDIPYFVGRAYEMAGVYSEAKKVYLETLEKLEKIKGTREERERRVTEHLPQINEVLVRLAKSSFQEREYESTLSYLNKINSKDTNRSAYDIERVDLLAKVSRLRGQRKQAKQYLTQLIDAWQGNPDLLAPTFYQLAEVEFESSNYKDAEENIQEIERLKNSEVDLGDDLWFSTMELKGKVLEKDNRLVAAIETYSKILDEFEEKRSLSSMRFHLGKLMFNSGNIKGAEKVWNSLDPSKSPMYVKLAKEKLDNARWVDDYKKYIQRIPAAANLGRSLE